MIRFKLENIVLALLPVSVRQRYINGKARRLLLTDTGLTKEGRRVIVEALFDQDVRHDR